MKHLIQKVSIPVPCQENWDDMTLDTDGRFCNSCQKTVIDFTVLSDNEVLTILSESDKICGRISDTQLQKINSSLSANSRTFTSRYLKVAALLAALTSFTKAEAKTFPAFEYHKPPYKDGNQSDTLTHIKGKVIDADSVVIAGATIKVNGETLKYSDVNGDFDLGLVNKNDEVQICFVGYKSAYLNVMNSDGFVEVIMQEEEPVDGKLMTVVAGGISIRRPLHQRIWLKVKRAFNSIF